MSKFSAIDLFAGIGGFRLAIERNGGKCINFSEINTDAINTYIANYPDSTDTNLGDITKLKSLPDNDFLSGGVPCQSWSIAGKNLGFDDDRGQLWNDALYLLKQSKPKAFMFENVKGLSDPRNRKALEYIMSRIQSAGYHAKYFVLNSFDYGVPQSRVRIYIIGFREKKYFDKFVLPKASEQKIKLADILDKSEKQETIIQDSHTIEVDLFGNPVAKQKSSVTSLSRNNNGYNDYFLLNDLRNGCTTVHSWDIQKTTERQKEICLLLLKNRRKSIYGCLDGNPLNLKHFQALDQSISQAEIDALVKLGILKCEKYIYRVEKNSEVELDEQEQFVLSRINDESIVFDKLAIDRIYKQNKIKLRPIFDKLEEKGVLICTEIRYDFKYTKISTGLFGINRIFLPCSNIFPTLVASDSNDYITPISIVAYDAKEYKSLFIENVLKPKKYRRITKQEACRIQGFPSDFILPDSRARWMKLIGNSVSVPVIETLVHAICATGVFD